MVGKAGAKQGQCSEYEKRYRYPSRAAQPTGEWISEKPAGVRERELCREQAGRSAGTITTVLTITIAPAAASECACGRVAECRVIETLAESNEHGRLA